MADRSRNLKTFYLFTFLQSAGRGIWMGNILSFYIVILSEQGSGLFGFSPNETLGITSAISGLALVLVVLPGGLAADKWSRDGMLRIGGAVGTIGLLFVAFSTSLIHIMAGLFCWGLFQGLTRPAAESIFANSISTGRRSKPYTRVQVLMQSGMAAGPLLNVFLFLILGDKWELAILKVIMFAGLLFSLLSIIVMLLLRDKYSLGETSESVSSVVEHSENTSGKKQRFIPLFLILSSFIIGTGAGMTVKFFPVFFRDIYGLKPIAVQLILGAGFVGVGLASLLAQKHSRRSGRVQTMLIVQSLAIFCLVMMALYPPVWIIIPIFILRGALMNAAQPLSRSIMMDNVKKSKRGLWNSFQTVAWGLFWNASAAIGGFLIGDNNYALCFFITAGVYILGMIPLFFLVPLVKKEKG